MTPIMFACGAPCKTACRDNNGVDNTAPALAQSPPNGSTAERIEARRQRVSDRSGGNGITRESAELIEKQTIIDALAKTGENVTRAAKALGQSRATLPDKLRLCRTHPSVAS